MNAWRCSSGDEQFGQLTSWHINYTLTALIMFYSREVWKIVIIYAIFGSLWIILSDQIFHRSFAENSVIVRLSIIKGMLFIATTSVLLFFLIARQLANTQGYVARLHATEERYQFLVENSSDCLVIVNKDGYQNYVSHGAEQMFGFKRDNWKAKALTMSSTQRAFHHSGKHGIACLTESCGPSRSSIGILTARVAGLTARPSPATSLTIPPSAALLQAFAT